MYLHYNNNVQHQYFTSHPFINFSINIMLSKDVREKRSRNTTCALYKTENPVGKYVVGDNNER